MDLKEYIINKSKEANMDIIAFTDCQPLENLRGYLIRRQDEDKQTEFEEGDADKRINPKLTLAQCKTIIVIGLSYYKRLNEKVNYKSKGILSRSTWGLDYHVVLKRKMEYLINEIKKESNFKYKYFVDTGPLIDRELAYKSGLGYYGKNCSIINENYGSFIFLGYILTDLDIECNSEHLVNQCGDCNLCLEHCPTGALVGPFKLNPKKCISYLTQSKGKIPYELRDKMGSKIYGCDTCQLVCPRNKDVRESSNEEFMPTVTRGYMDLDLLLTISNKQFKEKYSSMAGSWRGRNVLRRNGIIAVGNTKDRGNIKLLESLLEDSSAMIREYAAWAILNIDFEYGKTILTEQIAKEKEYDTRLEMKSLINHFFNKLY